MPDYKEMYLSAGASDIKALDIIKLEDSMSGSGDKRKKGGEGGKR